MKDIDRRYIEAKRKLFNKCYSDLNDRQREAVFSVNGPLLVLAGAGSGKTTVLVRRIAYIIKYGNAYMSEKVPLDIDEERVCRLEKAISLPAEQIVDILSEFIEYPCPPYKMLAITFTNKAANEIKSRLENAFDGDESVKDIWSGTFHSLCMRILRTNTVAAGLMPGFSIYDSDDSKKAIAAAMKRCNIDEKTLQIKSVQNEISRAKDRMEGPAEYAASVGMDFRKKQIARIYREYQSGLEASNALDFDDIIFKTVNLLRSNEDILRTYQARFRYVSVDEYQDTNEAQFALTTLLSGGYNNIMAVGDDDQSIYRFRGATIANILGFDKRYSEAKVIKLEQNYRSAGNILNAANGIISNNKGRRDKKLWTERSAGEKISVKELENQTTEAKFIVDTVSREVRVGNRKCGDFAVLYRTNAQAQTIEASFAKAGVPYRTIGAMRFYDRKEIRDMIAYLNVIINHNDEERIKRIINEPKRKIGDRTVDEVIRIAHAEGIGIFEVIEHASRYAELSRASTQLLQFATLINRLSELSVTTPVAEFVGMVADMSGYRHMLVSEGETGKDRLDNIDELISGALQYQNSNEDANIVGYLEEVSLVADVDKYDESADAVVLMTIHSAKGLEFPVVFLPGMEDGIFPGMQTITGHPDEMEEERRLAYVAVTRAKEKLYITYAYDRLLWGRSGHNPPSRFISEIPGEYVERESSRNKQSFEYNGYSSKSDYSQQPKIYFSQRPSKSVGDDITVNRPAIKKQDVNGAECIKEGDRVMHRIFGEGEVISVRNMGADILYEVAFDKAGTKKLMATYAKLTKTQN